MAACARTTTPPAQRLGLRGESDAILSAGLYPAKKEIHNCYVDIKGFYSSSFLSEGRPSSTKVKSIIYYEC